MRRWLMQMKPKAIENVIAMVALFRPGPMDFIPSYIRRMHGEEAIEYRHPMLEPIFKETYGFPVYQEQLMQAVMQLAGYSPPDADDLRKAISKKIKDKLLKHKEKFVHGAVERGIPEGTAEAIFDDWEEFARYGFNKSHAADYGIIAVQTGYLKCHYPEEYMTALLSVSQNDTDKVALYVADCRRMGIDVQPPSVNTSGWDFTIEDRPGGKNAIRFGLGAVKNVGKGPVDAILEAREDEPYTDINDFARRVDLRQVNKRPLECLIKVGALDMFGSRSALLTVLDQLLSISASHFRASDAGQISMFGMSTGISDEITLPKGAPEANRREFLEWERELIGLYVSDHPLSPVMDALTQVVTHFSGQLAEATAGEKVRVAGIVTRVRPHQTKTGKSMGFVTLEDVQGNIELVVFPRTWDKYWEALEVDKVVLVDGKVDAQSGDPKVLVDSVTTDLKSITSSVPLPGGPILRAHTSGSLNTEAPGFGAEIPGKGTQAPGFGAGVPAPRGKTPMARAKPSRPSDPDSGPIPPENFDPDWTAMEVTPGGFVVERGVISTEAPMPVESSISGKPPDTTDELSGSSGLPPAVSGGISAISSEQLAVSKEQSDINIETLPFIEEEPTGSEVTSDDPTSESEGPRIEITNPTVTVDATSTNIVDAAHASVGLEQVVATPTSTVDVPILAADTNISVPPYILPPAEAYAGQELRMITVILRPGVDKVRDNLRLRQCYGILISYSGHDRFAVQIFERSRGYRIEFPNYTTMFCAELVARLGGIVGADNVIVEPLRLH
jgi:DNA polymerase-3 subunit alpha